ncbi:MAG: restriction endonuclease subunit S [Rickettsiales bacterium]|jgi:hypothetical protein|nr:restriction endonuclease subunit S [Rickettsiales bacterium]
MKMINKELWQEFRFDEIFTITRGKRLATLDQVSGDIAYISSSKKNNGVDNYILPPSYMTIYENALTLSNSGSVGYCFYHPYKFVSSDHCTVIEIKDPNIPLDNYIALFLKPIIETMRNKYNFAREINNERLRKEIIILPVNHNKSPEWEYMRNVIKTLSKNVIFNNKEIVAKTKGNAIIDTSKWKEFIVGEIFEIVRGKRLIELDRISGSIPYYSASDYNNGLTDMIANPLFTRKDSLVYTTFGRCYYIEGEFTASDEISILHNNNLNVYNGTFIATIINQDKHKYSFGRKAFQNKFANNIIKLPVNQKGKPDFEFMENYIKSLPYSGSL